MPADPHDIMSWIVGMMVKGLILDNCERRICDSSFAQITDSKDESRFRFPSTTLFHSAVCLSDEMATAEIDLWFKMSPR